jgi:4-hydroxybenzoate polyprenyltransferase
VNDPSGKDLTLPALGHKGVSMEARSLGQTLRAYIDLTRAHFAICWPLLFCAGLLLAFQNYGGFSPSLLIRAALIGLFGLEAGMVMNDYVDREIDKRDVEHQLTGYWRPFKQRPIPSGLVSPRAALALFFLLVILCLILVATLPYPNSLYLLVLMPVSYGLQFFYQVKKRNQKLPWAQIVGRIDVSLFPVAGYLCWGQPDRTALLLFLFFYPWVLAHLGVNDLADVENDRARDLKTVAVLYGTGGAAYWIMAFTILHVLVAPLFLMELDTVARAGFVPGLMILGLANLKILKEKSPKAGLAVLPLFHLSMAIYVVSIALDYLF